MPFPKLSQCSLRMWGLRGVSHALPQVIPMFPTHVGIARCSSTAAQCPRHVPYACGDCAGVRAVCVLAGKCSLRMWGLRDFAIGRIESRDMFPTHVGIARESVGAHLAVAHVPYACGDCADFGSEERNHERCSLRMWGLRDAGRPRCGAACMFPTHVGIAREPPHRAPGHRYVPYACGDCARVGPPLLGWLVCSLRMWGLRGAQAGIDSPIQMFPTHVGIARPYSRNRTNIADVPYACGDCAHYSSASVFWWICSLRMWGLRARPLGAGTGDANVPYACGDCAEPGTMPTCPR